MKKTMSSLLTAMALSGALMVPAQGFAQTRNDGGMNERREHNERHPQIRAAIKSLERAKNDLQRASHDFGGHREALEACNNAIEKLKLALQYDKK